MPAPRPRTTRPLGGRDAERRIPGRGAGPGGGSSAVGSPTPARTFSGRFLVLTLVAVLIVFLAAPTTKIFLEQRAEIAQLESAIAEMEAQQASLEDQVGQWSDETYVKQRARERLLYVMPGERSYLVVGADEMDGAVVDSSAAQIEAAQPAWVDALWHSVVASAYEDAAPTNGADATEDLGTTGETDTTGDAGTADDRVLPGATDEPGTAGQTAQTVPGAPAAGTDEPRDAATDSGGSPAEEGTA